MLAYESPAEVPAPPYRLDLVSVRIGVVSLIAAVGVGYMCAIGTGRGQGFGLLCVVAALTLWAVAITGFVLAVLWLAAWRDRRAVPAVAGLGLNAIAAAIPWLVGRIG